MKKQQYLFSHSAFFDILLQQKVRQVGLSETQDALLSFTTRFYGWTVLMVFSRVGVVVVEFFFTILLPIRNISYSFEKTYL